MGKTHLKIVQDLGALIHWDSVLYLDDHISVRRLFDGYSKGADCRSGQQEHECPAEHTHFPHFMCVLEFWFVLVRLQGLSQSN